MRPLPLPSVPLPRAPSPLTEARAFLSRLVANRDRLLTTGVYGPRDAIIMEMGRRIEEYQARVNAKA
jgi:hypothetical protein